MTNPVRVPRTLGGRHELVHELERALQARDHYYRRRPLWLSRSKWLRWDAAVEELLGELVQLGVRGAVAAWQQATPALAPWQLPSEQQLLQHVLDETPPAAHDRVRALASCYLGEGSPLLMMARAWRDVELPVEEPFKPSTIPRRKNTDLAEELDRLFATRIPMALEPHIHDWVFDHRSTPQFGKALANPGLTDLSAVHEDVVVYRQVNLYHPPEGTPQQQRLTRVVSCLQPGDEVGFRHALSSGLNTYHYGTLGPMPPDLDKGFDPLQERCVKLEMAPKRGLYLPHRHTQRGPRELSEDEVVLPANSVWRVAGVRDLALDQSRAGIARYHRQRVLQLVEIGGFSGGTGVIADR